jgi:hypothetical protein
VNGPAYVKSWLDAISGDEKFLMTVGAGVVNSLLLIGGYIDQGTYALLIGGTVGAYIGGKTYENIQVTRSNASVQIATTRSD